jgi:hypothetical protein
VLLCSAIQAAYAEQAQPTSTRAAQPDLAQFITNYCIECHNQESKEANLALDQLLDSAIVLRAEAWETVVKKLTCQQMPPSDSPRPKQAEYHKAVEQLTQVLDEAAGKSPAVGHVEALRRLTRTEYQNAIRDLLALEIDTSDLLPSDESSHGFDNITVTNLSPALLDRYITAARKISRLAVGIHAEQGEEAVYRIRPDVTQDVHIAGTPLGTRGGAVIQHHFPQSGLYEIQIRLMRDRNDEIESLRGKHSIDVLIDRLHQGTITFERPGDGVSDKLVDANLVVKARVTAGPHQVAVAFPEQSSSLLESPRQPLNVHYNFYRHPRIGPAIYQISIAGPFDGKPSGGAPSRLRILGSNEPPTTDQDQVAATVLTNVARRAYRREVTKTDIDSLMSFYKQAAAAGGFDAGMESALSAVLVSPHFLFRIESAATDKSPAAKPNADSFRVLSGHELASRLSFFLWSSIPDHELLDLAKQGKLTEPSILEAQVRRMLADPRSASLSKNFASQWLYLRNLEAFIPDMRLYPDFDDNLRQAMKTETELLFHNVVHEDASVMQLIRPDHTFLNERLAKHYRIPNVYGSHFRRVSVEDASRRGGLLRQASILTVTSYATRTSPVMRGHWVLKNLLGNPPPPPPPDVPTLDENNVDATLSLRDRLQQHRANPACASCHNLMDPIGFALENYDAIGRWRDAENGQPIDSKSSLWNGAEVDRVQDIEAVLLAHPELFVHTLTEKLMTYALGRGIEPMDGPAVRAIVRDSKKSDYRFSAIVLGIVKSDAFQKRMSQ